MPRFAVPAAPKCARCGQSVFLAEQVIGPASKPYHKTCLTCVVCNKRLDSTLLVEHDFEPYCKNCHKEHLGTGRGGFSKAVTLNPTSPKSPRSPTTSLPPTTARSPIATPSRTTGSGGPHTPETTSLNRGFAMGSDARNRSPSPTKFTPTSSARTDTEVDDQVSAINIRGRGLASSPLASPPSPTKTSSRAYTSQQDRSFYPANPQTPIRSIDEAMASGVDELHDPVARLQAAVGGMSINNSTTTPTTGTDHFDPTRTREADSQEQRQSVTGHTIPSVDYYATPSPPPPSSSSRYAATSPTTPSFSEQYTTEQSIGEDGQPITIQTRRVAASDTIGTIRLGNAAMSPTGSAKVNQQSPLSAIGSLPPPKRPDPKTLTGAKGTAKIAPPRTGTNGGSPSAFPSEESFSVSNRRKSGIDRIGLSSSIVDASGGTPLCARCHQPVYFAEQKAGAGRKWHRACLRCDGCSTTLESGKLEEGPLDLREYNAAPKNGANVWCRICYAKYFGPKNLAVGLSLPETMR